MSTYDILVSANGETFRYYNLTTAQVFHILKLFVEADGRENVRATIRFF